MTISIVTATYNAAEHLPNLIESLRNQTDRHFQWVVADGASADGTLELLRSVEDMDILVSSQPDFGIYDALNRAISLSSGDYYIVAGADDRFNEDAIANFRRAIMDSGADIIAAKAKYGKKCMRVKHGPSWIFAGFSYIASHTLATAFKRVLHEKYGYYSRAYPIAADQHFVLKAIGGGVNHFDAEFEAGELGMGGVSSIDKIGNATEIFRVQVALGRSVFAQFLFFALRLLRAG